MFLISSLDISSGAEPAQLSLALLTGNIELAVDLCVQQARWGDALILAAQVIFIRGVYFC